MFVRRQDEAWLIEEMPTGQGCVHDYRWFVGNPCRLGSDLPDLIEFESDNPEEASLRMQGGRVFREHANTDHALRELRSHVDRQRGALNGAGGERIFENHASGAASAVAAPIVQPSGLAGQGNRRGRGYGRRSPNLSARTRSRGRGRPADLRRRSVRRSRAEAIGRVRT